MKIKVEIDVVPFAVPTDVFINAKAGLKQDGMQQKQSISLNDLSVEVVESLCDEFKNTIMESRRNYDDRGRNTYSR